MSIFTITKNQTIQLILIVLIIVEIQIKHFTRKVLHLNVLFCICLYTSIDLNIKLTVGFGEKSGQRNTKNLIYNKKYKQLNSVFICIKFLFIFCLNIFRIY